MLCMIHKSQMFITLWMNKQNGIYPYNRVLFNHKKERSAHTCHNKDQSPKHYAKGKKSVTKDHIWLHLYELSRIGKYIETGSR